MDDFVKWTKAKIAKKQQHELKNGILTVILPKAHKAKTKKISVKQV